jgi:hypothetical protein
MNTKKIPTSREAAKRLEAEYKNAVRLWADGYGDEASCRALRQELGEVLTSAFLAGQIQFPEPIRPLGEIFRELEEDPKSLGEDVNVQISPVGKPSGIYEDTDVMPSPEKPHEWTMLGDADKGVQWIGRMHRAEGLYPVVWVGRNWFFEKEGVRMKIHNVEVNDWEVRPHVIEDPVDNVVELDTISTLDLPPYRILNSAEKSDLESVVVCGFTQDGDEYFASSQADGAEALWILERCKLRLLRMGDTDGNDGSPETA